MLFAVDIGNTNVTIGVFEKENIVTSFRLNTDTNRFAEEYLLSINSLLSLRNINPNNIDSCVICSVVPPLNPIFTLVSQNLFFSHRFPPMGDLPQPAAHLVFETRRPQWQKCVLLWIPQTPSASRCLPGYLHR